MKTRTIERVRKSPLHPGFLGEGHMAAAVIGGTDFEQTDPFFLLMDDQVNLPGGPPAGGPHPHAGFETVTFVLEGNGKEWQTGSLEVMTAGKGIIHTETITAKTQMRILQLWLVLPPEKRWTDPFFQELLLEDVPTLPIGDSEIRVYSGSSNGLTSPLQNHTPFTLVDFHLDKEEVNQVLPAGYNGFIFVIHGSVQVGDTTVNQGETGWLDLSEGLEESNITFNADEKARFILYAAKPHGAAIVSHGPFIGDNEEDIIRLFKEYRQGKMPHLNDLPESSRIHHRLQKA